MILRNEKNQKVHIEFFGDLDDPQYEEAYYLDSDEEVSEDDVDFILYTYAADIDGELRSKARDSYFLEDER